ncbi:MAG: hypothetical protein ACT4QD_08820, partial [Acidobacteriota bacterium]
MRDRRRTVRVSLSGMLVVMLAAPAAAVAQNLPLAHLLADIVLREFILQRGAIGPPHQAHFSPIEANEPSNPAVAIVEGFNGQIATQFATFPLGSSTGGLTYVFDESLGTFR